MDGESEEKVFVSDRDVDQGPGGYSERGVDRVECGWECRRLIDAMKR